MTISLIIGFCTILITAINLIRGNKEEIVINENDYELLQYNSETGTYKNER